MKSFILNDLAGQYCNITVMTVCAK